MVAAARPTTELLDTYYVRVLGLAYQVLGDAGLATRAAETSFARLVRDRQSDLTAVWRVTVRTLHSYLVRGFTVEPLASDAPGWQAPLLDGLAQLEPEERILLLLRYHEGLDYRQLAAVLGVDAGRARQDVARARNHLFDVLGLRHAVR